VALSGGGFASVETIKVVYRIGLASPKSVTPRTVNTNKLGKFKCNSTIPVAAQAGALGSHAITATGSTTL
jgi:hypothetical protein